MERKESPTGPDPSRDDPDPELKGSPWYVLGRRWLRSSLAVRLTALLTLALVPLGLLAFEQTRRLEAELERVRDLNFHALTAEIARREATDLARAAGMARAFTATLAMLAASDMAACSAAARRMVERGSTDIAFVGFLPPDGVMRCTSGGAVRDFSQDPEFARRMAEPRAFVTTNTSGRMSGVPVISVHEPARAADGSFQGYVTASLSAREIDLPGAASPSDLSVALVDADGNVIGASLTLDAARQALPARLDPDALAARTSFEGTGRDGLRRAYAVEPILAGSVYAVGTRPATDAAMAERIPAAVFPLLMWLASLGLVIGVLESSLIGHVRALGRRMRRFGATRSLAPRRPTARPLPAELALIEEAFTDVASELAREELRLIDALHEQEVLMKEIHHRVKNNLQIISSIINLQVRGATSPETEDALSRISMRISSLAAVHRRLYESESVGRTRFDTLLRDVTTTLMDTAAPDRGASGHTAPRLSFDLAPVRLSPNQGLPGAMFAVEAVTNALKYATPDRDGACWIEVRLTAHEEGEAAGTVTLAIVSSGRGPEGDADAPCVGDGAPARPDRWQLGQRLIAGFARQLRGQHDSGWDGESWVTQVTFRPIAAGPLEAQRGTRQEAAQPAGNAAAPS